MPANGRPSTWQLRVSLASPSLLSSTACVTPRPKLSQPVGVKRRISATPVAGLQTDRVIAPRTTGMSTSQACNTRMPGAPLRRHVAQVVLQGQAGSRLRLDLADLRALDAEPRHQTLLVEEH